MQPYIFQLHLAASFSFSCSYEASSYELPSLHVIGSKIPFCPKESWLLGQRSLYPTNRYSKCLKGHMERETLGFFIRSAIYCLETLGNGATRGSERVSGAGVPGIPQQVPVFTVAWFTQPKAGGGCSCTGGQGCWESLRDTQTDFSQFNCRNWKSSKMEEAHFRHSFLEKSTINKFPQALLDLCGLPRKEREFYWTIINWCGKGNTGINAYHLD